jgi:hypothetical protein
MAAMCLVEIVSSRPSAKGAQAVEQDRSDEAPSAVAENLQQLLLCLESGERRDRPAWTT